MLAEGWEVPLPPVHQKTLAGDVENPSPPVHQTFAGTGWEFLAPNAWTLAGGKGRLSSLLVLHTAQALLLSIAHDGSGQLTGGTREQY